MEALRPSFLPCDVLTRSGPEQRVAVLVMAAVMISGLVSLGIAGDYIYLGQMGQALGVHAILIVTPVAGILRGLTGRLFSRLVLDFAGPTRPWLKRMKARPVLFAGVCSSIVALLAS